MPSITSGIPGGQDDVSVRNVPYIVVKGDKLRNVAVRFMVPLKTLKKINKISSKNFTCYPGMTLIVPVRVRPRGWDPAMESSTDAGMLSQDRLPSVDYEVIGDGFDLDIKDDFIPVAEALDDSVQFVRVGTHITRIEKRVSQLSFRMDSLKQVEFTFGHDDDINSVLGRMRLARDRYYINGPLGKEIDSLHRVKATLHNLRIRLRNRITEYEYLRDNEAYAKANYERDEMAKDRHWGDQITYESNYARIKAKHDELMVSDTAANPHRDTAAIAPTPVAQAKDTVPAAKVVAADTPRHTVPPVVIPPASTTPAIADSKPAASQPATTPAPKPATAITPSTSQPAPAPVVKPVTTTPPAATAPKASVPAPQPATPATTATASAPASSAAPRVSFGLLQRVDIAPLVIRHARVSITEHPRERVTLALLSPESMQQLATLSVNAGSTSAASLKKDTATSPIATKADSAPKTTAPIAQNDTASPPASVKTNTGSNATSPAVAGNSTTNTTTSKTNTVSGSTPATAKQDAVTPPVKTDSTQKQAVATAKTDTTRKATVAVIQTKEAGTHNDPATPHSDAATNSTALAPGKEQAPAAVSRDTAHNFSMAEDNELESSITSKNNTGSPVSDASSAGQGSAAGSTDNAPTPGRPSRKPKDQAKNNKKPTDSPDQVPVVVDSSKILHEQFYVPVIAKYKPEVPNRPGPYFTLDLKYDSAMLYREKKINPDPLASYKTDSNFMATDVMLKEIPITEVKNKPKYLIPVDSVSKIKGEFYLIRARQVLERGDFKEGDKYLRKSLELDPNNAATWMLHADLCLTTGAADKALKEYAISGEIDSSNPKVFYNIALLYAKANDNQKAYKYFSRATDVNDKYLLAYMGRATVLMDERDYEGAIQDYDKTLSINRYYSPAYKGRALAKMEAHKFEDAVVDFNQYLEIEDPDGYILYQRGIAKILSNNLLQGCLDLSSSLELGFKEADRAIKKFCQ